MSIAAAFRQQCKANTAALPSKVEITPKCFPIQVSLPIHSLTHSLCSHTTSLPYSSPSPANSSLTQFFREQGREQVSNYAALSLRARFTSSFHLPILSPSLPSTLPHQLTLATTTPVEEAETHVYRVGVGVRREIGKGGKS